ncbi:hypothetical protein F5148DRAFT_1146505 [Russula earlei]|uniref:Uncharacterized protein n=1 Tax=Russula earlei TaxID=71964 RepID=A0ACC0ULF4_9AGAM|nr:hypothetical protein F5148DRAFT_1146505 [Russula earlei]
MSIPTQSTTQPVYVPKLPAELWLLVFRFATSAHIFTSARYEPFQSCHHTTAALSNAALSDKCTLTLVCKQWRALATDILYEDIRIGRGISALHAAFSDTEQPEQPITEGGAAPRSPRYRVRRAVLPYAHTATPTRHAPPALALLALLPHLEVLVRPPTRYHDDYDQHGSHAPHHHHRRTTTTTVRVADAPPPRFEFPTGMPALPALRRLEWAFDPTGAATRAGGINALDDVLRAAPALEELVLVGRMPFTALRQHRLRLPALRTLRLHAGAGECPLVARQTTYWALPALENVVVRGAASAEPLEPLWEAFGGQVRVLEMELATAGGVPMVDVGRIASACPALEECNVRVLAEEVNLRCDSQDTDGVGQSPWACAHDTLKCVGICVVARGWTVGTWVAIAKYVARFGKGCPALRNIVLYVQDVGVVAQNAEFHALHETLLSSGTQLVLRSVYA